MKQSTTFVAILASAAFLGSAAASWPASDFVNPIANPGVNGGGVKPSWFGWPDDPEIEALRQAFVPDRNHTKQKQLGEETVREYLADHRLNPDWDDCTNHSMHCPPPPPCPFAWWCQRPLPPCAIPWCPLDDSVGDYGEILERMSGVSTSLSLGRGLSAPWSDGGFQ